MRIALYQMHIAWEDKNTNIAKLEEQLKAAEQKKIDAIFLPEMSFTGFSMNTDVTKEAGEETILRMKQLSAKYNIAIGFGWVKDCRQKSENHYTVVDKNGNLLSDYAKLHPFSYSGEDMKFQGGERLSSFMLEGVPCSNFICYDLRFPEIFQIASKAADVIILPANWPAKRSNHWKTLLQARAIENQAYVLAINCVGQIDSLYYSGDSCVINPDGQIIEMLSDEEGLIIYDLSDDVEQYRSSFPVKKDRREALYQMLENSMTEKKAVIFDMDGVIFDSERLVLEGWIEIGKKYGIPDIEKVFPKCIGVNAVATKQIFLDYYGEDFPYDTYREETSRRFHEKYDNGRLPMKPGIKELLQYLRENGYRIGLASSTRQEVVRQELADAGILPYFETLTCGDMVKRSKPEPDIFLKAAETLGLEPQECIVIEDSYNGIRAASRACMFPIMVPDMIAPDGEMKQLAGVIFDNLYEVKGFLLRQNLAFASKS